MNDDGTSISDQRVISNYELDEWAKKLHSIDDLTPIQRRAIQNFTESCVRFINRRAELHLTSLQFYEVARLNRTTMDVQADFYYRTEVFFQGFYSCLSQLANVVHRFPSVFPGVASSSNEKFLKALLTKYPEIGDHHPFLEEARAHRNFLDHPVSNEVSDWMTTSTGDERALEIIHFGVIGQKGKLPSGAQAAPKQTMRLPVETEWYKVTPNHFEIEDHFKATINLLVGKLIDKLPRANMDQKRIKSA